MDFEERMLAHVLAAVDEAHGEQIAELFGTRVTVPKVPFPRITMAQAHEMLKTAWFIRTAGGPGPGGRACCGGAGGG